MPRAVAEDVRELLARLADRRRIDERHVGGRVRHQDRVIKRLVARLQIRQHEILLQIVIEIGDLGVPARHLQLHRGHGRRQQTFETPGTSLGLREGGPFVQARVAQQIVTGRVLPRWGGRSHWFGHLIVPLAVVPRESSNRTRPLPHVATWAAAAKRVSAAYANSSSQAASYRRSGWS